MGLFQMLATMSNAAPRRPLLILFGFESNSGGQALNTDADPSELEPNPLVQILVPATGLFADLDIGTNQNTAHAGLNTTYHGWHLGLSEQMKAGTGWPRAPLYICEGGQGGSQLTQWNDEADTYYMALLARADAAVDEVTTLEGVPPLVVMFVSFGINDAIHHPDDAATWGPGFEVVLDRLKDRYDIRLFCMDIIPSVNAAYDEYRDAIEALAASRSDILLQDMEGKDMEDENHLSYLGMKQITPEKMTAVRARLG